MAQKSPRVRVASSDDLAAVYGWLRAQEEAGVEATFMCNWSIIERAQMQGDLLVCIDQDGEPVAFQLGGLLTPGILEIRVERRGEGIGREFAEHCMAVAQDAGEDLLFIQCKPSSSIPFWKRMGFTLSEDRDGKTYGFQVMRRELDVSAGTPIEVAIEWYDQEREWDDSVAPIECVSIAAVMVDGEGQVCLPQRVHYLDRDELGKPSGDVVVRVVVEGEEWYCGKAKREGAKHIGVLRCRNGYFVDRLSPPA